MTPLEKIKAGILANDMNLIVDGYNSITGSSIAPPKPKEETTFSTRQVSYTPNTYQQTPIEQPQSDVTPVKQKRVATSEPYVPRKRINLWFDEGETPVGYTEKDKIDDEKNRNARRSERPASYTPIRISCITCGLLYDVNPIFAYNGVYTCDKCGNRKQQG